MTKENGSEMLIVVASSNEGKIEEFRDLLSDIQITVISKPKGFLVEETGETCAQNARLKAIAVAKQTGQWALADASGLSVKALGGLPGVHSARYATTDSERLIRLLKEMESVEDRKAHFTAALCVASPVSQTLIEVEGRCDGLITRLPRGKEGFGYDPVFEVVPIGLTFAEMGSLNKQRMGHRGIAFSKLKPKLKNILDGNIC